MLAFKALRDPNIVVLALKGAPGEIAWRELRGRAAALERKYGLPFTRMVERLRAMNRWSAQALRIAPGEGR